MPELPEAEAYRRLAERALDRVVAEVVAPDGWYLKRGLTAPALAVALEGRAFTAARRRGKVVYLDTSADDTGDGPVLGLAFGMSGRLVVDGVAGVDNLLYTSDRALGTWDRFAVRFADGGDLRVRDPRRLGGVFLDPDEDRLGPDAASLTLPELRRAVEGSRAPLKARLMDQSRLSGVGNLIADELLWRAGLDPARPAGSLPPAELRKLHRHLRATVARVIDEGGSHTGRLMAERRPGGICPRDGTPLVRRMVGGRTTWSCPRHQT